MTREIGKVLIKNRADGRYLLLRRTDHPRFGNDPDLPGGTIEDGESVIDGTVREVLEEVGIAVAGDALKLLYRGDAYSSHKNMFNLYFIELVSAPTITLDWEHSSYMWCSYDEFLASCHNASDSFMHMAADTIENT